MAASAQPIAEAEAPHAGASVIAYDGSYDWKRHDWSQPLSAPMPVPQTQAEWKLALSMPMWRIASGVLYKIVVKGDDQGPDDVGQLEPFLPNVNQLKFLLNLHYRNIVLKARQLGFTTLASIMALDRAMFTPNQRCGIIADEMDNAASILTDKVLVAYENLPAPLLAKMPLKTKNATQIRFKHNNSSIRVAISMRGGTIHFLHISELGKIASKYPAKAKEIRAGSLPAVPKSGICTIESTAEGADGLFFEMSERAEAQHIAAAPLTQGDYNFHFFPWYLEPGYRSNPKRVKISPKQHEYFDSIEAKADIALDMWQRAWYVTKLEADFGGDAHLMQQEMPSTPEEAWSRSTQGTYLTPQLTAARAAGRIGKVPHIATLKVHTAWDIGAGDGTGIWMFQQVGTAIHVIRYIENWSKGYAHYVRQLRETGWVFGQMLLPHDAAAQRQVLDKVAAPLDMLMELAKDWDWRIVPRVHDFQAGIDLLRAKFPEFWFDEEGCKEGLNHLALYRKKFNSRLKSFQDEPEKYDGHSEAPDALRQIAQGFDPSHVTGEKKKQRRRATGLTA